MSKLPNSVNSTLRPAEVAMWCLQHPYGDIESCARDLGCTPMDIVSDCNVDALAETMEALKDLLEHRADGMLFDILRIQREELHPDDRP